MKKYFAILKHGLVLLPMLILATSLTLTGCGGDGSDSYDTPTAVTNAPPDGHASNVLIEPATLKSWMDQGLVASDGTFDGRVVILDFNSDATKPRIKGACRVTAAELNSTRLEGVGNAAPMVATGAQMDAVIQRLGIDENTTIVFTTNAAAYQATRAYWIFRYWGFPKERLKVLDGLDTAFAAAYPELMTTEAPTVAPSTYSVRNLNGINDDLRASVGEMIEIVKTLPTSTTNVVLDARATATAGGYWGKSATPGQIVSGSVVVFDGHPVGGGYLNQADLYSGGKFKSAAEIKALFEGKGWAPGKKVTVYCTTGYSTSPLFFALDAILGGDVQLFDGSWSQLGKYSSYKLAGGELADSSLWAIDKYMDPVTLHYNALDSAAYKIEPLDKHTPYNNTDNPAPVPFLSNNPADNSDVNPDANQIEEADKAAVGNTPTVTFAAPVATATTSALIEPSTLETWMDLGLVNKAQGGERVVLLDVTTKANYDKGHIPGAQHWDAATQAPVRLEGPADVFNMPLKPADMTARLQGLGIDANTTIVITSSDTASYTPSRAYFTLRYYGWPKDRIKVLNGYNFAWPTALTTTATDLADSTLTVQQIGNLQPNLRASLPEFMDGLRDGRGIPVDFRGSQVAAYGSTPGGLPDDQNADGVASTSGGDADYVVFEGTVKGGKYYNYTWFQVDPSTGDYRFKPADVIENDLKDIGLFGDKLVYSICRGGNIATTAFFVLDAVLGWPVMVYDGSWSQWGQLSDNAAKGGMLGNLTNGSLWAVDNTTYMESGKIFYNKDALKKVEPLTPDAAALNLKPADAAANQIEKADDDYQSVPPAGGTSGPPTSSGGSSGGGC